MPDVNKYYNPSRGQYVSQFVPEELPTNLLLAGLENKQKLYNQREEQLIQAGQWQQAALPGYDTKYVQEKKKAIEDFVSQSQGQDLTSPEYYRNYLKFVNNFKNDEGLKRVQQAVDTHQQFKKIEAEIKSSQDVNDYEKDFFDDYLKRYNIYTHEKGQGFKGPIQLGDTNILRGTDINKELEGYFDQLKADGADTLKELDGGIAYKNGWKGIGDKKIEGQAARTLDLAYQSRAGQQLGARFDTQNFSGEMLPTSEIIRNMSPEQRQDYEAKRKAFVAQQLLNVGKGFKFSETDTNKDAALNKQREEKMLYPQQPNIPVHGNAMGFELPNYDEALGVEGKPGIWQKSQEEMSKYRNSMNTLQNFLDHSNNGNTIRKDSTGRPMLTSDEKLMLEGIPGGKEFMEGKVLNSVQKEIFSKTLRGAIDDNNYKLHNLQIYNKSMEEKMRSAIGGVIGDKKYGNGVSFKSALELGEDLDTSPEVMEYKKNVTSLIDKGATKEKINEYILKEVNELNLSAKHNPQLAGRIDNLKDKIKDLVVWKDAEMDLHRTINDPTKKEQIKQIFDTTHEYAPVATLKPSQQFYIGYDIDPRTGKIVSTGKIEHADWIIEDYAKKTPQAFKVYVGDRLVKPGDPDYPSPESLQLASANKEFINDRDRETGELTGQKAVFNFSGTYKKVAEDPRFPNGTKTGPKLAYVEIPQNYTFVASGVPMKNYTEAKAKEAFSNYVVDKNSEAGKQSLIDFEMYKNPDRAKDMSKVNALVEPGQRTTFSRRLVNLEAGKKEDVNIKVKKSENGDGTLILSISDRDGNKLLDNKRFNNVVELNETLRVYEERTEAELIEQQKLGVAPTRAEKTPEHNWLINKVLSPKVPIDQINISSAH